MSLRWFVYYCALVGGWAAFVGWIPGRFFSPDDPLWSDAIRGLLLGVAVALGLGLLDTLWNVSLKKTGEVIARVGAAVIIGCVGGFLGGLVGHILYQHLGIIFFVVGWVLTGLLIGASIGAFEWLMAIIKGENTNGPKAKFMKSFMGGTVGGAVGGTLAALLGMMSALWPEKDPRDILTPTCWGFVALGACIGLLVGMAQVLLKEAWIKVEAGFRPGREMILQKEKFTMGRAEVCDLGLFGDATIEKIHCSIIQEGSSYFIEDSGTASGTFVNDQQVTERLPLQSGDLIRIGRSLIKFNERAKKSA